MRPWKFFFSSLCLWSLLSLPAYAQAIVEYSLGTAKSGVAGQGAKGIGKSVGSVFSGVGKALEKAGKPGSPAQSTVAAGPATQTVAVSLSSPSPAPASTEQPSAPAEDPALIASGLERQELLAKFGKPSMKMSGTDGGQMVETYWYKARGSQTVVVTVRDGKVASVNSAAN